MAVTDEWHGAPVLLDHDLGTSNTTCFVKRFPAVDERVRASARRWRTMEPSKRTNSVALAEGTTRTNRSPASFSYAVSFGARQRHAVEPALPDAGWMNE